MQPLSLAHTTIETTYWLGFVKCFHCCAVWISGIVQTGLYADFFYYYFLAWQNNERLKLPA